MPSRVIACRHCGKKIIVPTNQFGAIAINPGSDYAKGWAFQARGKGICPACILVPEAAL